MRTYLKISSIFVLFFAFTFSSFALNAPLNLKIDTADFNSVTLSWDKVDGALMYDVYYWTSSSADKTYDNQTDLIENTSTRIENLTPWMYYFSVVSIDGSVNESEYSNEVSVNVWEGSWVNTSTTTTATSDFALKSIDVIALNWVELTFSKPLEDTQNSVREFKVVNKNDPLDTFEVVKTEINPSDSTKLLLTLDKDTQINNTYEVTIVAIKSADWSNIESWIDSTEVFTVEDKDYAALKNLVDAYNPAMNNVDQTMNSNVDQNVELNSASEVMTDTNSWVVAWNTTQTAQESTSLPTTWPEEYVLLLLLSLMLGFWFVIFKTKNS